MAEGGASEPTEVVPVEKKIIDPVVNGKILEQVIELAETLPNKPKTDLKPSILNKNNQEKADG